MGPGRPHFRVQGADLPRVAGARSGDRAECERVEGERDFSRPFLGRQRPGYGHRRLAANPDASAASGDLAIAGRPGL